MAAGCFGGDDAATAIGVHDPRGTGARLPEHIRNDGNITLSPAISNRAAAGTPGFRDTGRHSEERSCGGSPHRGLAVSKQHHGPLMHRFWPNRLPRHQFDFSALDFNSSIPAPISENREQRTEEDAALAIAGVQYDEAAIDADLAATLRADAMERFRTVQNTVMINPWQDDLDWITVDSTYPAQIRRRYALLLSHRAMVIDRLPGEDVGAAEIELRNAIVDYVLDRYPAYFDRTGNLVSARLTGLTIDVGPSGADPLVAVALLASEDLLLLLAEKAGPQEETVYLLKTGALLFPNEWGLRSHFNLPEPGQENVAASRQWHEQRQMSLNAARLGKTPYEIHNGRVSHYMEHFAARVHRFLAHMKPGMRTWRRNWAMKMSDELFLHSDASRTDLPPLTPENWAHYGYLRSEQQTFTKLPVTKAVVFSIKTYLWKLSDLVENPVALHALLMANDHLAPGMMEYRADSLPTFRQFLEQHRGHVRGP
jgi:hypothetical protein